MNVNLRYKPDWLFELNPIGLVPVLQWDDKFIYESATCNDFLDEVFPQNKLNPEDPYLRARDRQIWESIGKASLCEPAFCICENKDADQLRSNCAADQRLCFRYTDSTIPLLPKSEIPSL